LLTIANGAGFFLRRFALRAAHAESERHRGKMRARNDWLRLTGDDQRER
jgi:hypothetical protein